ncbi:hypothetical protein [Enterococcus termitis]|uniref:Uncharacterized protein n=1 Tax=Enterococcus termitis TaxID=332950 RepID=A0A1E5GWU0_9ENTE|nr:hypothetical protein [Enterococcus termitis]OEG16780.1 hypothetical protein BCR25_04070 [Enterococcus termitis]OJG99489.1 hypothetical protein RV18_GL001557 [Enterococcus termitis]
MFGKSKVKVLTRKQIKEICLAFKCQKNEFVARKFEDGFLVSIRSKEYRVKFSEGFSPKIVYAKEVKRVSKK